MGDEDELTDAQKLSLAQNFITNSPPAQQLKVVEDVRALVGATVLTGANETNMLRMLNTKDFAAVTVPGGGKVLLTPHGELPDGSFLDPAGKQVLRIDHAKVTCEGVEPMQPDQLAALEAVAQYRDPIDAAMRAHVEDSLPKGALSTYGSSSAASGIEIVCCYASLDSDLSNYWAGRWWGEWRLSARAGGSVGQLTGTMKCNVHYFEDGNVQLTDGSTFQCELPLDKVGENFAKKVQQFEQEFLSKLEDIYQTLSEQVIQSLRRRLPITRTKFDWDKHAVAKLAVDLQTQAGLR